MRIKNPFSYIITKISDLTTHNNSCLKRQSSLGRNFRAPEAFQRFIFFAKRQLGLADVFFHRRDGFIIRNAVHGIGRAVLAAVREAETRRSS